jgi:hypothetical protein
MHSHDSSQLTAELEEYTQLYIFKTYICRVHQKYDTNKKYMYFSGKSKELSRFLIIGNKLGEPCYPKKGSADDKNRGDAHRWANLDALSSLLSCSPTF